MVGFVNFMNRRITPIQSSIDLTGRTVRNWTVLHRDDGCTKSNKWICRCVCGTMKSVSQSTLLYGSGTHCHKCKGAQISKSKAKSDLTNQRFGAWTVLRRDTRMTHWICKCDCGTEAAVSTCALTHNKTKGCRFCKGKRISNVLEGKRIDLVGQRFGRLLVIAYEGTRDYAARWTCQCDCGTQISVATGKLTTGWTQSCGCLHSDSAKKVGAATAKDLTNMRFGNLVALMPTAKRMGSSVVWHCMCDCGASRDVSSDALIQGRTVGCYACSGKSRGELKIAALLKQHNIPFSVEHRFLTCKSPETNYALRFDFFVDGQYIIEYDGRQHFSEWDGRFSKSKSTDNLAQRQMRDEVKNQWCHNHNIPIIRVPYTHYKKITIEDLLVETSPFLLPNTSTSEGFCDSDKYNS